MCKQPRPALTECSRFCPLFLNNSKRKGPPPDSENLGWLEIDRPHRRRGLMKRPWNVFAAMLCANNRALSWQNVAISVRFHRNHSKRKGPPPDSENLGWLEIDRPRPQRGLMKRPWNVFAAMLCANNRALSWQIVAVSVRFHRNHSKRTSSHLMAGACSFGWAGWNRTSTGRVKVCQDVAIYLAFLKSCTVRAQFYLYLSLEIFALPSSMSMCVYFCVVDTQAWPSMDCTARMLAPLASK